ncbi:uncharacterized protein (DUF2235 family) [Povalibacter uvarum]|uniref:Uncharacterized protein (DUF2235 family) n=1 Tax=Povalibacter uvarum TaxID=732238 RepID=A0A841HM23_9GAMM|nr:DUF2235 domain-containing protein [Povalibacter uvarum]MBB6094137.1 uncharacterized protein (DUF2235 family) [Povalibacter uvarum]
MGKNIIICSDGTGNTAIKGRGTNVFKMFECIDVNSHRFHPERSPQVAIYDDGVGTESMKLLQILGGAAGYGLSRNVRQLYKELCRIYDPGDRIFLFGFSRGAFTVRSLSGFIGTCGIIDVARLAGSEDLDDLVKEAYQVYRGCYRTWLMKKIIGPGDREATTRFRERHCHGGERIHFVGVWDTVDAVGLPLHISNLINTLVYQFKFPDLVLSKSVDRAIHALAIDDERQSFHPLIWDERQPPQPGQSIEQVWFAGVHSNVGGGYPKQGMSLVALDWIMHEAEQSGLRFVPAERQHYREHANVDDKLYDPRAGLGTFYRWLPRDIAQMCKSSGVQPKLHLSVLERIAHGTDDYRPGNLPANSQVVITPSGDPTKDAAARERAEAAQQVLQGSHPKISSLLEAVGTRIVVGRFSYRVFALTIAAVLLLGAGAPAGATGSAASFFTSLGLLLFELVTSPIDTLLNLFWHGPNSLLMMSVLVVGLLVAWLLSSWSTRGMERAFAEFWFTQQQKLRAGLKRARARSSEIQDWRNPQEKSA